MIPTKGKAGPRTGSNPKPPASSPARVRGSAHGPADNDPDDEDEDHEDELVDEGDEGDEGGMIVNVFLASADPEGGCEDEGDEEDEEEGVPPLTVPNDAPEVRGFLLGVLSNCAAGLALVDYLTEWDDPRAEGVALLMAAQPVFTDFKYPASLPLLAAEQWGVIHTDNELQVTIYPGTPLSKVLSRYGGREMEYRFVVRGRPRYSELTRECVRSAFEVLRRRMVFSLFDTTAEEVRCPPDQLIAVQVRRLVRTLRRDNSGDVSDVCDEVEENPALRDALLAALTVKKRDHGSWVKVMDRLNPGWCRQVAFKARNVNRS